MKANKAEIHVGKNPAECHLIIDGKEVKNVVEIKLSLDVENGPILRYYTTVGGVKENVHDVDFDIVVDHEKRERQFQQIEAEQKRILTVKEGKDGKRYFS